MLLTVSILPARQLTPEEAFFKATGGEEVQSVMSVGATSLDWKKINVLHTCRLGDINALYVMKATDVDKVMIVAADDVARPLLGWFDAGSGFDASDINPTLQWWLDTYVGEIAAAVGAGAEAYDPYASAVSADLKDVAPMITTRWNQSAPYNNLCPTIDGRATYTGCVATAMAQIVNFHRWPERCTGFARYYWTNGADSLRLDMTTIAPDWDNMTDIYNSSSTAAQQQAVAELMKACGYASHMNYGTSASGALTMNMLIGLIDNFGYAKSIEYLPRDCYGLGEWVGILHNELVNHRPVYYAGQDTGGHAFVVDGFRSPDYFHINWGWGGMSDGYFVITALDPSSQGIGGSSSGYNYGQEAVIGIQKDYAGSVAPVTLHLTGDFSTVADSYTRTGYVRFLNDKSYIYNSGQSDIENLSAGVRLTDKSDGTVTTLLEYGGGYTLPAGYAISSFNIFASNFPEAGEYLVEPIVQVGDEIMPLRTPVGACKSLTLDASDTNLNFAKIANTASVRAVDLRSLSRIYQGKTLSLEATVEGLTGEYYSTITPKIYQGPLAIAEGTAMLVDIPAGTSRQVKWTVDISELPVGLYQVYIADDANHNIGGPLGIEVNAVPEGTPDLTLAGINCDATSGDGTWRTPWVVPANHISLTAIVNNAEGLYDDYLYAFVFPLSGGMSLATLAADRVTIGPDDSYQWIIDSDVSTLEPGTDYFIRLYWRKNGTQTAFGDYYYITASEYASIGDVVTDPFTIAVDPASSTVVISDLSGVVTSAIAYSTAGIELGAVSRHAAADTLISLALPRGVALLNIRLSSGATVLRKISIP
ncbi:MAG: C10 family peptidase [Paramuribaculum sp.]|nr:C10 family peptidase [Paramuribaculum sp.]